MHHPTEDNTYHGLCYTSRRALAGTRIAQWVHPMKDRSDDPSHHERTHLPRSYISLPVYKEREREMFYLTTHSTHFIYGCMASDIWLRTILIVRKETRCRHIGYSYRLTARVLLYAPSLRLQRCEPSTYQPISR